jgi:hypothetical protein
MRDGSGARRRHDKATGGSGDAGSFRISLRLAEGSDDLLRSQARSLYTVRQDSNKTQLICHERLKRRPGGLRGPSNWVV